MEEQYAEQLIGMLAFLWKKKNIIYRRKKYLQQIFSLADEKVSEFWVMQIQLEMFV